MRHTHTKLVSAAVIGFALALALASVPPARGQNVAQPPWRGRPALASRGHPGLALLGYVAPVASGVQGQDAPAMAGALQEPASLSGSPLQPVTVERRGRLLVLTYGPRSAGGGLVSFTDPRGEPPRFAVYQGQRQIASGQFEYG